MAIIATVAAILAVPGVLPSHDESTGGGARRAKLHLDQVIIRNGVPHSRSVGGRDVYTSESAPTIDVTLRNSGNARAVIVEAQAEIVDFADLSLCYAPGSGGDVPVAKFYDIKVPFKPRRSERQVKTRFIFEIEADGVGRFGVRVAGPDTGGSDTHLYLLDVTLRTRGGAGTIKVGRVLIATPGPISRGGAILPEEENYFGASMTLAKLPLRSLWCYERNVTHVKRLAAQSGARSEEIAALDNVQVLPRFSTVLRSVPPAVAARRLLNGGPVEDLSLAVLAAGRTRDATFEAQIRRRVARALYRRAASELLDGSPDGAAHEARIGLEVLETQELVRVLADAERRASK